MKRLFSLLFAMFLGFSCLAAVGCNEGPVEEGVEEIEDEVDDNT